MTPLPICAHDTSYIPAQPNLRHTFSILIRQAVWKLFQISLLTYSHSLSNDLLHIPTHSTICQTAFPRCVSFKYFWHVHFDYGTSATPLLKYFVSSKFWRRSSAQALSSRYLRSGLKPPPRKDTKGYQEGQFSKWLVYE